VNAVGLQNVGVRVFLKRKWPELQALGLPVIVSIAGQTAEEFGIVARELAVIRPQALEVNLSCPNVHSGGETRCFAQSEKDVRDALASVKAQVSCPVYAKLQHDGRFWLDIRV